MAILALFACVCSSIRTGTVPEFIAPKPCGYSLIDAHCTFSPAREVETFSPAMARNPPRNTPNFLVTPVRIGKTLSVRANRTTRSCSSLRLLQLTGPMRIYVRRQALRQVMVQPSGWGGPTFLRHQLADLGEQPVGLAARYGVHHASGVFGTDPGLSYYVPAYPAKLLKSKSVGDRLPRQPDVSASDLVAPKPLVSAKGQAVRVSNCTRRNAECIYSAAYGNAPSKRLVESQRPRPPPSGRSYAHKKGRVSTTNTFPARLYDVPHW